MSVHCFLWALLGFAAGLNVCAGVALIYLHFNN
jgi:hypothetical protein